MAYKDILVVLDDAAECGARVDVALGLAQRHEAHRIETRDVSVADMLLNRIADESIDLLVMAAYGHARVREIWLGGVTRDVLRHMTVPVLVSH